MKKLTGITIVLLSPIILLVLAFAATELNKAYWDREVKKLCEVEGGVSVFEMVTVSLSEYPNIKLTSKGSLILPHVSQIIEGDPFFYKSNTEILRKENPAVRRYESQVVRAKDEKILGEKVTFSRVGGDFPTIIGHPPSYSCSSVEWFESDLFNAVIKIKER